MTPSSVRLRFARNRRAEKHLRVETQQNKKKETSENNADADARRNAYLAVMAEPYTFDTHKFIKRLTESGLDEKVAEVLADEQAKIITGELATKADIAELHRRLAVLEENVERLRQDTATQIEALRQETKKQIKTLRLKMKQDVDYARVETDLKIETVKSELIRWIAAFGLTIIALNLAGFALIMTQL